VTLGQRLKRLRNNKRWTLKEAAEKLGLSGHSTYSNWEYGRTEPDLEMLKKIAELFDVDVQYLLTGNTSEYDVDFTIDLEELLKDKNLTWKNEILSDDEKKRALEILKILLNGKKDTN
jgi:transcriptional regulator with XRE-family HTH domain